jgi:predicted nicotinamide N-methyase
MPNITVTAAGRDWVLCRPANLETLWDAMTGDAFGDDERLPYWVELWPASIALADWLAANGAVLRGRRCLDMGCGLGLTAIAASSLGARVVAMDYEAEALAYAKKNAAENDAPQPLWTVMDWRRPAVAARSMDYIWGGDIMYERRFVEPVLRFIGHALAPGGTVWMAEPNRDVYGHFRSALFHNGWTARPVHTGRLAAIYEQPERVSVTLWEMARD